MLCAQAVGLGLRGSCHNSGLTQLEETLGMLGVKAAGIHDGDRWGYGWWQ